MHWDLDDKLFFCLFIPALYIWCFLFVFLKIFDVYIYGIIIWMLVFSIVFSREKIMKNLNIGDRSINKLKLQDLKE